MGGVFHAEQHDVELGSQVLRTAIKKKTKQCENHGGHQDSQVGEHNYIQCHYGLW